MGGTVRHTVGVLHRKHGWRQAVGDTGRQGSQVPDTLRIHARGGRNATPPTTPRDWNPAAFCCWEFHGENPQAWWINELHAWTVLGKFDASIRPRNKGQKKPPVFNDRNPCSASKRRELPPKCSPGYSPWKGILIWTNMDMGKNHTGEPQIPGIYGCNRFRSIQKHLALSIHSSRLQINYLCVILWVHFWGSKLMPRQLHLLLCMHEW